MTGSTFALLSGILSFGAPMAFAVYEIVTIRRDPPEGGGGRRPPEPPRPKPLPDCLQPKTLLARPRLPEWEDA